MLGHCKTQKSDPELYGITVFQHSGNFREIRTTKQGVSGEMSTIVDTEIGVFRAFSTQPFRCVRKARQSADNPATIRVT